MSFDSSVSGARCEAIWKLEDAMVQTKGWMDQMRLKMNFDKTEFIKFGTPQQLKKCTSQSMNVKNQEIEGQPWSNVWGLGLNPI